MKLSPHAALLTNIYEDHLNWHKDLEDYIACKKSLFSFQNKGDFASYNLDDPRAASLDRPSKATNVTFSSVKKSATFFRKGYDVFEKGIFLLSLKTMGVDGEHNYHNALGAISLARQFSVKPAQIVRALKKFTGVEGREQLIRDVNGIKIFNDTTATAMEAMLAAMNRFSSTYSKKIVMISGGMDKNLNYLQIAPLWKKHLKALVLLEGTASEKMANIMDKSKVPVYKYFGDFKEAVDKAYSLAQAGDMIILCPGATSFNMFDNEFDRGKKFNKLVEAL